MQTTATIDGRTHRLWWHTDHSHPYRLAGYCHMCGWTANDCTAAQLGRSFRKAHQ